MLLLSTRFDLLNYLAATHCFREYLEIGDAACVLRHELNIGKQVIVNASDDGTSDAFFENNGTTFDLILIDGFHTRQQVLRDVRNALRCLRPGGCIVLHDCLPGRRRVQEVPRRSRRWTGDVWKAVVELRTWPDIDLAVLNVDCGLGVLFARPNSAMLTEVPELSWETYLADRGRLLRVLEQGDMCDFIHCRAPGPVSVLEVPNTFHPHASWNPMLVKSLIESQMFEVRPASFPLPNRRRWRKFFNLMRLDGALLAVDTWDGPGPTAWEHPLFHEVDLVLKIEHQPHEIWQKFEAAFECPVSSWTMFGYEEFPVGYFQWEDVPHPLLCGFSGHIKREKHLWIEYMVNKGWPVHGMLPPKKYMPLMPQWQWGVVLQGRVPGVGVNGKNRREHAFTSCGMPLALNYQPSYPFPMAPDVHYVYLRQPSDLDRLADIDPTPFAAASRQLWLDHFSPRGMATTLQQLMRQLLRDRRKQADQKVRPPS